MGKTKIKLVDDSEEKAADKKAPKTAPVDESLVLQAAEQVDQLEKELETSSAEVKKTKTTPKSGKAKQRSAKYQKALKEIDRSKSYKTEEAVGLVKKASYSSFPGTLEIHINTKVGNIRGLVSLPFSAGKRLTILAFGKDAEVSGAEMIGDEEKINEIGKGKVDFDLLITTAEWMPKLARVAKNLGPKGLMPNPKNGTITTDLKKAVESFQAGKTEYRTENKAQVMHLPLGKLTQPDTELTENVKTLIGAIGKSRIKKVTLAPSMGPSVKLDLSSL